MSELKRKLKSGSIRYEAGVLNLKWSYVRLESGDDEYLQSLGVVWIIKGEVLNPLGLILPNDDGLHYCGSERIVLPRIVKYLELHKRTDRELVLFQYIQSIYISSGDNQLEVIDVRCDVFTLYNTLFNRYLRNRGISRCSENLYLMKMGVCLN